VAGKKKITMKNYLVLLIGFLLLLTLSSCAPIVKADLKSLQENPEKYKGKKVIITADIKSVVEAPEAYRGKRIEISGYVKTDGFRRTKDWGFLLEDQEGRSILCNEREYRVTSWLMPVMALRRAEKENKQVTVEGKLLKNLEIELDWIEYEGQHYDTDFKPPQFWVPFF
jgi:hypothetical protein